MTDPRMMIGVLVLVVVVAVVVVEHIAEPLVVLVTEIVVVVGHIAVVVERIVVAVVEHIVGLVVHTVVHVAVGAVGSTVVEQMFALELGLGLVFALVVAERRTRWSTDSTFR